MLCDVWNDVSVHLSQLLSFMEAYFCNVNDPFQSFLCENADFFSKRLLNLHVLKAVRGGGLTLVHSARSLRWGFIWYQ